MLKGSGEKLAVRRARACFIYGALLVALSLLLLLPMGTALASADPSTESLEVQQDARDFVFVLDVSGSMQGEPIAQLQTAALLAVNKIFDLSPESRIAIVAYSNDATVVAQFCDMGNQDILVHAINNLRSGGGTYMEQALLTADALLDASNGIKKNNIIFISDGLPTDNAESIIRTARNMHTRHRIQTIGCFVSLSGSELIEAQRLMQAIAGGEADYHLINDPTLLENVILRMSEDILIEIHSILVRITGFVDVEVTYNGETLSSQNTHPSFGELQLEGTDNIIKRLLLDPRGTYDLRITGIEAGTLNYEISYPDAEGSYADTRAILNVPIGPGTVVSTSTDEANATKLQVDVYGDGNTIEEYAFDNGLYPNAQQVKRSLEAVKEITGYTGEWVGSNHEAFCIQVTIPNGAEIGCIDLSALLSLQCVEWYDYRYLPEEKLPIIGKTQKLSFWFYNNDQLRAQVALERFTMACKASYVLTGCGGVLVESNDDTFCVQVTIPENAFVGALHIPPSLEGTLAGVMWDQRMYKPGDLLPLIGVQQELLFWFHQQADVTTAIANDLALFLPSERSMDAADEKQLLEFEASDALFPAIGFANLQLWEQDDDSYCVLVMPLKDIRIGMIDLSKIPQLVGVKMDMKGKILRTDEKFVLGENPGDFFCWFSKKN